MHVRVFLWSVWSSVAQAALGRLLVLIFVLLYLLLYATECAERAAEEAAEAFFVTALLKLLNFCTSLFALFYSILFFFIFYLEHTAEFLLCVHRGWNDSNKAAASSFFFLLLVPLVAPIAQNPGPERKGCLPRDYLFRYNRSLFNKR